MADYPVYAVIADYSSGLDEQSTQIMNTRERAVEHADALNREAEGARVPVHYRVFVLRELDESAMWDWGLRGPGGVFEYVNERAARACASSRAELVRRRAGSAEWEAAP